jgi:putative ABC transport system permease protein
MIRNYLKTAWRTLWKNGQASAINILGLALGIAVFLLIIQYVAAEWSANRFHKNFNQLYRVSVLDKQGKAQHILPPGYAPLLKDKIPGIENYVRIANEVGSGMVSYAGAGTAEPKAFREKAILYVDDAFLQVFSFPVVGGTARLQPNTLGLSQQMAGKLFGTGNAIGKTVTVSNQFGNTLYTVAAVYKDMPETSDIKAEVLLSLSTLASPAGRKGNDWADPAGLQSGFTSIYLLLQKGTSGEKTSAAITAFAREVNPEAAGETVYLQPLRELHLAPSFNYPYQTFGSLALVVVFSAVALLILFIAWVNYINLSTAQALNRAHEVGVRKVLGARRAQLVVQYLTETFLITLASILIALLLVNVLQPLYNSFTGKSLSLAVLQGSWFLMAGITLLLVSSGLAGGYVAFFLSRYKPITILRGKGEQARQNGFSARTGLVVFQFAISIVFIIATLVLYRQLGYMQNEKLGMNLNERLVVKGPTVFSDANAAGNASYKNVLAQLPFVTKYTASNGVPGQGYNFTASGITRQNPAKDDDKKEYAILVTDERFFDTYGITFAHGKSYTAVDAEQGWDKSKKVVLNQKAAIQLGFSPTENLIGKKIMWGQPYEIAGVVQDYHHASLREPIRPTVYLPSGSYLYFTIQTDANNMPAKLDVLKKAYLAMFPGNPFEYFFADASYDQQYHAEQKLGRVFVASAAVAILIACMGLFGLVSYAARQRTKEIGIRKVLGASVADITALLSKDFVKLVAVAVIIASPVAWWLMQKWLQDFAYRTAVSWWIFLAAGILALLLALATVCVQAIKAAVANPVKSLRSE